jgi:D-3-phosphoglycerate dehydrogenase / 2-oxoglutarate reductase
MPRVLVTPAVINGVPGPYKQVLEAAGLEVVYPPRDAALADPAVLTKHLQGIDAVLASVDPFNRDVLSASRLRVVARMGVGYDSVDVPAATERGVVVTITPGTNEHSVAEQAIALITGVFRGLPGRIDEVRTGKWLRRAMPRLAGRTIGLLGLGRIGKALVSRAQGLGLEVIAYDPYPDRAFAARHGVDLCGFDELLSRADIVSLHLPSTPETANIINAGALRRMKRGSVLINTARGTLVDEGALVESLRGGHLLGAGLDVFQVEPLPTDSPLLQFPNVLVSPHTGGLDEQSLEAMGTLAAQCVVDLYQGRWPDECVVNRDLKGKWKWAAS